MNDKRKDPRVKQHSDDTAPEEEESLYEKVVPEGLKRGIEGFMRDSRIKSIVGDFKLPKEIVAHIMSQVDDTKQAALGIVSREVRLFLEHTNLSEELSKLLTQISFEVKTQIRFVPNDKKLVDVKHSVSRKTEQQSRESKTPPRRSSIPPRRSSIPPRESKTPEAPEENPSEEQSDD